MRALSSSELLDLYFEGRRRGPVERALLLVARAWPEGGTEAWASLPLGRRDALVMALRAHNFGGVAPLKADCPACGEDLDASIDIAQVLRAHPAGAPPEELELERGGRRLAFRLPTSADLLALAAEGVGAGEAPAALLRRLVLAGAETAAPSGGPGGRTADGAPPEPETAAAMASAIADADPLAEVTLELVCEECGERTEQLFDAPAYLWAEVEAAARRVLAEIHLLARAYGWTEDQILALDAERRAHYLELVQA